MIVLDSSAAIDWLIELDNGPWVDERIRGEDVHAPHVLDIEVVGVVRKRVQRKELTLQRATAALSDFVDFNLARHPHTLLLGRMWELRANFTASDAAYVALAELLGAALVTTDSRLARAPGIRARIVAP